MQEDQTGNRYTIHTCTLIQEKGRTVLINSASGKANGLTPKYDAPQTAKAGGGVQSQRHGCLTIRVCIGP